MSDLTEKRGGLNAGQMLNGWRTGCSNYAKCFTEGSGVVQRPTHFKTKKVLTQQEKKIIRG